MTFIFLVKNKVDNKGKTALGERNNLSYISISGHIMIFIAYSNSNLV